MVMPRSRSMSMLSSTCSLPAISRSVSPPVIWIRRSASVDFPWSIWATIEKLRMLEMGVALMRAGYHPHCRAATGEAVVFKALCAFRAVATRRNIQLSYPAMTRLADCTRRDPLARACANRTVGFDGGHSSPLTFPDTEIISGYGNDRPRRKRPAAGPAPAAVATGAAMVARRACGAKRRQPGNAVAHGKQRGQPH